MKRDFNSYLHGPYILGRKTEKSGIQTNIFKELEIVKSIIEETNKDLREIEWRLR